MYICVPDGRLALHGGEAGSKKETCRAHLKRGKKHGTNSAKARHQHGPGATEGTGKVRRPASSIVFLVLNLTRSQTTVFSFRRTLFLGSRELRSLPHSLYLSSSIKTITILDLFY